MWLLAIALAAPQLDPINEHAALVELTKVYSRILDRYPDGIDRIEVMYWRASANLELKRTEAALADLIHISAFSSKYRCPALQTRLELEHPTSGLSAAIETYATECAPNEIDWRLWARALLLRSAGEEAAGNAILCRLALESPERISGWRAGLMLAESAANCPAQ